MPATFAAQAQARKLTEKFTEWVWSDPDRTVRLVTSYNEKFNSLRPARYDGAHLNLPGLGDHFTPHAYQRDAVARIIAEPTVLRCRAVESEAFLLPHCGKPAPIPIYG